MREGLTLWHSRIEIEVEHGDSLIESGHDRV